MEVLTIMSRLVSSNQFRTSFTATLEGIMLSTPLCKILLINSIQWMLPAKLCATTTESTWPVAVSRGSRNADSFCSLEYCTIGKWGPTTNFTEKGISPKEFHSTKRSCSYPKWDSSEQQPSDDKSAKVVKADSETQREHHSWLNTSVYRRRQDNQSFLSSYTLRIANICFYRQKTWSPKSYV